MRFWRAVFVGLLVALLAAVFGQETGTWPSQRGFATGSASQEVVLYEEDFEDGQAQDWELESGWTIIRDTDGNRTLRGQGPFAALYRGDSWGDYTLRMRVKLVRGLFNLSYRVRDCLRYFVVFGEEVLALRKTFPCGTNQRLSGNPEVHDLGRWYEIEVAGRGGKLEIRVDGVLRISYADAAPLLYGTVILDTVEDSEAYVDDVVVLGQAPLAPPLPLQWVRAGGPLGGLGYDIRMRPDNPDIMYVTDAWSGVHISTDGGETWEPSSEGITTRAGPSGDAIPVFSLTIDPHNSNVIWCGTQNRRGIFKSTDGGKTWIEKDNGVVGYEGISFRGFTVDPRNSDIVYAAAEIASYAWSPDRQPRNGMSYDLTKGAVYKTTDGGEHWTAIWRGDNLARYIWINPLDPDVLYISTGIFDREAANSDARTNAPGGVGILKSRDGGRTWQVLNQANGLRNLYIGSLFMHPTNPGILLAGAGCNSYPDGSGVYLTIDAGQTWRQVLTPEGPLPGISSVEFSVSNPRIAYAGNQSAIYRSEDGGNSWRIVSGGPMGRGAGIGSFSTWGPAGIFAGEPIDFQVDPRDPDRIFANNYGGGNFLSEDGGRTWTDASRGYTGANVNGVVTSPTDYKGVYVAARCNLSASSDCGVTWDGLSYVPAVSAEWYAIAVVPTPRYTTLLASDEFSGTLVRSMDGGRSWSVVFRLREQVGGPGNRHGFKALVAAPSRPDVIYAGMCLDRVTLDAGNVASSFGVYKSTDGGLTWDEANDARTAHQNVNVLAVAPGDDLIVYAGTVEGGVFKTIDGGASWQALNQGLRVLDVRVLAINPTDRQVLYAGVENGGVYKSTSGGASWQSSSSGMDPQAVIRAIVIDPTNPQVLYAADLRTGVYRSQDGAKTWVKINEGLRTRAVKALAISADGGFLYAGTNGEGVFRLDLPQ